MSTWVFLVLLLTVILFAVAAPLWSRRADKALGSGIESDEIAQLWSEEKDRLVAEQRTLDMALANDEISEQMHKQEREILQLEASRALERLQKARASSSANSTPSRPARHRLSGGILVTAVVFLTGGGALYLAQQDFHRNVSPHADGRMPIPAAPAGEQAAAPGTGGGARDIAAMVKGLEERVEAGGKDASTNDMLMLARSYRVMKRNEEAITLYKRILEGKPDNLAATMAVGSMLLNSKDKSEQGEADRYVERALRIKPDFPEALWLKSLVLVRNHKIEKAKTILNRLTPLVQENPPAKAAVESLLSRLEEPLSSMPKRSN